MSFLTKITPLILTWNEEANIGRTLERLGWAERVVVIDSGSTDGTERIARGFAYVDFKVRPFDAHAAQWNYGLDQIAGGWVLALDADYQVTEALRREVEGLEEGGAVDGFWIPFRFCIDGVPLRAALLPPRLALFRREKGRYCQDGHTQLLELNGTAGTLREALLHDDRKPLARWLEAQDRYAELELEKLLSTPAECLRVQDRLRRTGFAAPFAVLIYCLVGKGLILDGWRGWRYTMERVVAEMILAMKVAACGGGPRTEHGAGSIEQVASSMEHGARTGLRRD